MHLNEEDKQLLTYLFLDQVFMEYYDNREAFSIPEFSCVKKSMFNIVRAYLKGSNCACDGCKVSSLVNMRRQIIESLNHPCSNNLISVNTL